MAANNLSYQFKTASVAIKLIVINLLIFLVVNLGAFLFDVPREQLTAWFVLPDSFGEFILQPWSFLTYSFLHFGFWHLFWNMLWLYWFSGFILNLFSAKRFLAVYLLGALCGGLLYVLSYNLFPVFTNSRGYLLGASAAVTAIVVFIATYSPNTQVRIIFFTVKLWHIAAFFVIKDLVQLPTSGNAGGLLAHLGGAILGYVYALQLAKGNDIGKWFETLMDRVAQWFTPRAKKPFKKVHRTTPHKTGRSKKTEDKSGYQKKVDAILDKIGKSGYDSLTKAEKDFLFKAGKED
ncbi:MULTISPECIES: rhomboid family intramembrane serine protease [Altibacter]|uniref:rhomboid family intramembrane serine protease n=1 Tax=Altibacter TaxID=1535231 RepID=UPI000557D748|nr:MULTISPECIES: rhomboid family intramembrane serine protease [Altibacter]MCW8980802.1 rhomboid family intramembrane serine protease [Altibacter sp.]MCW9037600.1 rhomboid family intramembrane serine protease [Altibacter sp.]